MGSTLSLKRRVCRSYLGGGVLSTEALFRVRRLDAALGSR